MEAWLLGGADCDTVEQSYLYGGFCAVQNLSRYRVRTIMWAQFVFGWITLFGGYTVNWISTVFFAEPPA